jgi:hypothetical protein
MSRLVVVLELKVGVGKNAKSTHVAEDRFLRRNDFQDFGGMLPNLRLAPTSSVGVSRGFTNCAQLVTARNAARAILSGDAPDLTPVESLCAWLTRHALANYCSDGFAELRHTAGGKLKSAQRPSVIIASCWPQAELI